MPDIRMPDGTMVRFPDDMSETTIRGMIAQKFPREVAQAAMARPPEQRSIGGHRDFGMEDQGPIDAAGAYAINAVNAVPLAGPALSAATKAAASVLPALTSNESFGDIYDQMGRKVQQSSQDHPIAATAGGVTGAVAGTLPLMSAAPAAFGLGGGGTAARLAASTMGGAGLSAADTGIRTGGDVDAMKDSAKWGGGLGLAGPIVGPLIGKGVKGVADKVQFSRVAKALGLDKQAAGFIKSAGERDALTPQSARQALAEMGPDGMLLDLGPNMKNIAAGLFSMPGEGKQIVKSAIAARDADANWRIRSALDGTLGDAPIPSQVLDRANQYQARLQPEYRQALRDAGPVDTLPIARYLETEAQTLRGEPQRLVQRVRAMLDHQPTPADIARARANGQPAPGTTLVTDAAELLNTRHAIDDMLETAQGTHATNALTTARQAVDDELRASVPGIKEVDAKYAELARQKTALQRGQTVLSSGREAPRPIELSDEFRQGALPQGMQIGPSAVPLRLRQGARAEIERLVGTNANDRARLAKLVGGEGDWNRARLSTLFGKDKAGQILDVLDRERAFADTSGLVTRNSESAARIAAQNELIGATDNGFGVQDAYAAGGIPGAVRGAAIKGADKVIEALRGIKNDQVRAQIASTLTSQRSPVLDALLAGGVNVPVLQIDRVARALLASSAERR